LAFTTGQYEIGFRGRTPNQLAKQLINPKTNGNKTFTTIN
jgi:hypothetical protein